MTTAITLETSRGDLGLAVALGLILLAITFAINAGAYGIGPLGAAGDGMRAEASILPLRLEGRRLCRRRTRGFSTGST